MVDFAALGKRGIRKASIAPREIFDGLSKPSGVNDLYSAQSQILDSWLSRKNNRDNVIKLNTGGGKTLVGLLIALSSMAELKKPALYLAENKQLAKQVVDQAVSFGIRASEYSSEACRAASFLNGETLLVGSYQSLFNGRSSFGIQGSSRFVDVGCLVIDDAHASLPVIRKSFTIEILSTVHADQYQSLTALFRPFLAQIDKEGVYNDLVGEVGSTGPQTVEIPHWAWQENLVAIRDVLARLNSLGLKDETSQSNSFAWSLIRDELKYCRAIVSKGCLSIAPVLPMLDKFPSFMQANRRIFMSATFADDSALVETFGLSIDDVLNPIAPDTLAGTGKALILPFNKTIGEFGDLVSILKEVAAVQKGAVVLSPSFSGQVKWNDNGVSAPEGAEVSQVVADLRKGCCRGPVVFANRYNGIDLSGDSCRLLVIDGIPAGFDACTKNQESILQGSIMVAKTLAERIEQGIGRGVRGSGDYCAVILVGADLIEWVKTESNQRFFTRPMRAQIMLGLEVADEIRSLDDFRETVWQAVNGESEFQSFVAERTAEIYGNILDDETNGLDLTFSNCIREAFDNWREGDCAQAGQLIRRFGENGMADKSLLGFLYQLLASIAMSVDSPETAFMWQKRAHGCNKLLPKAPVLHYSPNVSFQVVSIVDFVSSIKKRSRLESMLDWEHQLTSEKSAGQFEEAVLHLGQFLGFDSQRFDVNGLGPDNLWLIPNEIGLVFEAKSRREDSNAFGKDQLGQLLNAGEWFRKNYPTTPYHLVSIHPNNTCTPSIVTDDIYVLTMDKLIELADNVNKLVRQIYDSPLDMPSKWALCADQLHIRKLEIAQLLDVYFERFRIVETE